MLCSATYRYNDHQFLNAVPKISVKFSGGYFSDTLLEQFEHSGTLRLSERFRAHSEKSSTKADFVRSLQCYRNWPLDSVFSAFEFPDQHRRSKRNIRKLANSNWPSAILYLVAWCGHC